MRPALRARPRLRLTGRRLREDLERLSQELARAQEVNPGLLRDYEGVQAEAAALRQDVADCERDYQALATTLTTERTTWQTTRATLEGQLEQMQHAMGQERRSKDDAIGTSQSQHTRALEALRREHDAALTSERARIAQLEEERRRLSKEVNELQTASRASIAETEGKRMAAEAEAKAKAVECDRKEELRALFEKESKLKQERVEESMKLLSTVQGQLNDAEGTVRRLTSELEVNARRVAELEKSMAAAEQIIVEERSGKEAFRESYEAIGAAVDASGAQVRAKTVLNKVHALVEELRQAQHEAVKQEHSYQEVHLEANGARLQVERSMRERDEAMDTLRAREDDLAATREELLNMTVELRTMIDRDMAVAREQETMANVVRDLEQTIADRDHRIEQMQCDNEESLRREAELSARFVEERGAIERDLGRTAADQLRAHRDEVDDLRRQLADAEQARYALGREAEDTSKFAQLGLDLCRLLRIESGRSAAAVGNDVYRAVEALQRDLDAYRAGGAALGATQWVGPGGQRALPAPSAVQAAASQQAFSAIDRNHDGVVDRREFKDAARAVGGEHAAARADRVFTAMDANGDGVVDAAEFAQAQGLAPAAPDDGGMLQWYKDELRRSEERHARTKQSGESFKRDVAEVLKFGHTEGTRIDATMLLTRIRKLMSAPTPLQKKLDASLRSAVVGAAPGSPRSAKSAKVLETLQRKFRLALETIESLEEMVEWLKAKLRTGAAPDVGLAAENDELSREVARLKGQLFADGPGAGSSASELDNFRAFHSAVSRLVARPPAGKTPESIIREIKELATRHRR